MNLLGFIYVHGMESWYIILSQLRRFYNVMDTHSITLRPYRRQPHLAGWIFMLAEVKILVIYKYANIMSNLHKSDSYLRYNNQVWMTSAKRIDSYMSFCYGNAPQDMKNFNQVLLCTLISSLFPINILLDLSDLWVFNHT